MKNTSLKKIEIVKVISKKTGLPSNLLKKIIDDIIDLLINNLIQESLNIKNIGSFKIIKKKKRLGRNPKTKKKYLISSRKVVSFTPSKKLAKKIRYKYE